MAAQLILGIDEAGRGPVIGPLVLCGVWVKARDQQRLLDLGARDSKSFGSSPLARERRAVLAAEISAIARQVTIVVADAPRIDRRVARGELNLLERELAQQIIDSGPPAHSIVADGQRLFAPLTTAYPQLVAQNHADAHCPVVAAASIVAKVERDRQFSALIAPLEPELGPIRGGGYANPATAAFLRAYLTKFGRFPEALRQSWSWPVLAQLAAEAGLEPPTVPQNKRPAHPAGRCPNPARQLSLPADRLRK